MPRPVKVPRACAVCLAAIQRFELISGVPLSRAVMRGGVPRFTQLFGHYLCVKAELGADRALQAMEMGLLPYIPAEHFVGYKLRKFADLEQQQADHMLKVYEFIG